MMKFKEFKEKYKIRSKDKEDIRFINVRKCISGYSDLERWKLRAVTKDNIEMLNYGENIFWMFSLVLTAYSLLFPHSGKADVSIFFVIFYILVISYIFFIRGLKKHRYVYLLSMLEEYETEQEGEKKSAEIDCLYGAKHTDCHQARNVVECVPPPAKELTFSYAEQYFSDHNLSFTNVVENNKGSALIDADVCYTNTMRLLSDQCEHSIKCTVFEGTGKRKVKLRQEVSGCILKQMEEAYDYIRSNLIQRLKAERKAMIRIICVRFEKLSLT